MDPIRQQIEAEDDGREAGRQNLAAGLNPHQVGTKLSEAWERGRSIEVAKKLAAAVSERKASSCRYIRGTECDCGGRGLCLDVA